MHGRPHIIMACLQTGTTTRKACPDHKCTQVNHDAMCYKTCLAAFPMCNLHTKEDTSNTTITLSQTSEPHADMNEPHTRFRSLRRMTARKANTKSTAGAPVLTVPHCRRALTQRGPSTRTHYQLAPNPVNQLLSSMSVRIQRGVKSSHK